MISFDNYIISLYSQKSNMINNDNNNNNLLLTKKNDTTMIPIISVILL